MPRNDINPALLRYLYYKKLLSKKEIALKLGCNVTTVHKRMTKFEIESRGQKDAVRIAMSKKVIKINKTPLLHLYLNKKLSLIEIAKILKYDVEIIRRELIRNKIQLRTQSEAVHFAKIKKRVSKAIIKTLYYDSKLTQNQIAKRLGKSREHISLLMKEYKLKTRGKNQTSLKYPKQNFSEDLLEKAYLLGFRAGDLHVKLSPSRKYLRVDCTTTKSEQLLLFRQLFEKYGFIWVSKPRSDGNQVCMVLLNHSFDFLLPKKDIIPIWIRKEKKFFFSYLAGYTDAEGCMGVFNKLARITIASYDKNILKQIYEGLNKFGIVCNQPRVLVKKGHRKSDGIIYRKDHWHLTLVKKSSLLLLFKVLETNLKHKKRINDLQKAKENIILRNNRLSNTQVFLQKLSSV